MGLANCFWIILDLVIDLRDPFDCSFSSGLALLSGTLGFHVLLEVRRLFMLFGSAALCETCRRQVYKKQQLSIKMKPIQNAVLYSVVALGVFVYGFSGASLGR